MIDAMAEQWVLCKREGEVVSVVREEGEGDIM